MFNIIGEIAKIQTHFKKIDPNSRVTVDATSQRDDDFIITIRVMQKDWVHSKAMVVSFHDLNLSRDSQFIENTLNKQLSTIIEELSTICKQYQAYS